MMVVEELVSGEGWISDESSLYGGESEEYPHSENHNTGSFWSSQKSDLNTILASTRAQQHSAAMSPSKSESLEASMSSKAVTPDAKSATIRTTPDFLNDRKAMENARLARLGKRDRDPTPEPALFNRGEGSFDAWQMGESVDDFVKRLPPLTTSALDCAWIWAYNPYHDSRDKSASPREAEFRTRGTDLLARSLQTREGLQAKYLHGPKAALMRSLNQESKALQHHIGDLAVECGVLSGKWMLFPKLEDVTRIWKIVVQGAIDNRLGPTVKVAPDEGKPDDRLICVYTKDFRDEDDILRVLSELETMGLISPGRSIYYKSDAYTLLDLYKQTASEYGLQASLYTSAKMLAAAKVSKSSYLLQKKQKTLNNYF